MSNENRTMTAAERAALANAREAEAQRRKYAASARVAPTVKTPVPPANRASVPTQKPMQKAPAKVAANNKKSFNNTNEYPNVKKAPQVKKSADKEDTGEFPTYLRTGKGGGFKAKKTKARHLAKQHRRKMNPRLRAVLLALGAVAAIIIILLLIGVRYNTITLSDGTEIKFFGISSGGVPKSGWISNSESGITGKISENRIEYSDGSVYEGPIVNAMRSGQGKYTAADGSVYEGTFSEDKMTGQFTVHFADGTTYSGGYVNNKKSGHGYLTYKRENGFDTYEGDFLNDKRHGKGTMTYADGNIYIGGYVNDYRSGEGEIQFNNGDVYKGLFANDLKTEGVYSFVNEAVFVGTFVQDSTNDMFEGTYTYTNGSSVSGRYDRATDTFIQQ